MTTKPMPARTLRRLMAAPDAPVERFWAAATWENLRAIRAFEKMLPLIEADEWPPEMRDRAVAS